WSTSVRPWRARCARTAPRPSRRRTGTFRRWATIWLRTGCSTVWSRRWPPPSGPRIDREEVARREQRARELVPGHQLLDGRAVAGGDRAERVARLDAVLDPRAGGGGAAPRRGRGRGRGRGRLRRVGDIRRGRRGPLRRRHRGARDRDDQ